MCFREGGGSLGGGEGDKRFLFFINRTSNFHLDVKVSFTGEKGFNISQWELAKNKLKLKWK